MQLAQQPRKELAHARKEGKHGLTRGGQASAHSCTHASGRFLGQLLIRILVINQTLCGQAIENLLARRHVGVHHFAGLGQHVERPQQIGTTTHGRQLFNQLLAARCRGRMSNGCRLGHRGATILVRLPQCRRLLRFVVVPLVVFVSRCLKRLILSCIGVIARRLIRICFFVGILVSRVLVVGVLVGRTVVRVLVVGVLVVVDVFLGQLVLNHTKLVGQLLFVEQLLERATHALRMRAGPVLCIVGTRTHHVEHAQHRRHRSLVVTRARRARGKTLIYRCSAQQQEGQRGQHTEHPEHVARGHGNERNHLEERQHQHRNGERPTQTLDERLPLCQLRPVERVLARGVVVRHDDDGTVALNYVGTGSTVHANDVLAAGLRTNGAKEVVATAREGQQHKRRAHQHKAHHHNRRAQEAREQHTQEEHHQIDLLREARCRGSLKLLELRLKAMLREKPLDELGRLEFFLTVNGGDVHLIVQVVGIVARCGHVDTSPSVCFVRLGIHPFSIRLPDRFVCRTPT